MNKPEWLSEFPFLDSQWSSVIEVSHVFADLESYDLASDWQQYLSNQRQSSAQVNWFALLRKFRKSRLAYFAFQDLALRVEAHPRTMKLVADLADLLVQKAYQLVQQEMTLKHGEVVNSNNESVTLMVYALGKLGTGELNYSSDIDLVFLYGSEGVSNGQRALDAASYFVRFGQKIIKLLDHYTTDGQVYRVDMRLRPFGSAGPLACSIAALNQYLLIEGREWERFAWMRARMVCGKQTDHERVHATITPFVYRKHLDYAVLNSLVKIKTEIAENLAVDDANLKHGSGGIRAVEFIVQSMQLVFGGRINSLQGVAIKQQLQQIYQHGKLQQKDHDTLLKAWLWLRKIENISQAVADQNSHQVPDNDEVKAVISLALGNELWEETSATLLQLKNHVELLFRQLFELTEKPLPLNSEYRQLFNQLMGEIPQSRMPAERREQVEQLILKSIGLVDESILRDFMGIVKSILTRPSYLLMLQKESNVHRSVLNLLAKNQYFSRTLQQFPVLLEQLFEHEQFKQMDQNSLAKEWSQFNDNTDLESWMEGIRYFKLVKQFNLIVAYTENSITAEFTRQQLTTLAQFILTQVVQFSWQEISQRMPQSDLKPNDLVAIAYGSAAVDGMVVSSDLDLVFVLDVDQLSYDDRLFSQKWVKKITHHLSSHMYHGKLYELDMQLRPNGQSGTLVTTRLEFEKYQTNEAWLWEHAAMIKSKALVANQQQRQWHQRFRSVILQRRRNPETVDRDLSVMKEKLNQAHSYSSHAEDFEVLAAILKHSHDYPELSDAVDLEQTLKYLRQHNLLNTEVKLRAKKDPAS